MHRALIVAVALSLWCCSDPAGSNQAGDPTDTGTEETGTDPRDDPADAPDGDIPDEDDATIDAPMDLPGDAGDADTQDVQPDVDDDLVWTCTPVGTGYSDGFFTLAGFQGQLLAGQFGYGHEARSMVYTYPPWTLSEPGLTGISESVCAMLEHDGFMVANTESSGDIFRTRDGRNWERTYDGENGSIGCGLAVLDDTLYAINYRNSQRDHGRILRETTDGWEVVYDSGEEALYIREIVTFEGTLYAFATNEDDRQGAMLTSTDGTRWERTAVPQRYFRGYVWQGALWLGSTTASSTGDVAVWRFDGETFDRVLDGDRVYFTDLQAHRGNLFASTSNGWKDDSGPSSLWMSPDGRSDWQEVCRFSETAAWSMAVADGQLYVGTWEFGGSGSVYLVDRRAPPSDEVDCAPIAANPAWEVCESDASGCQGVYTDGAGCDAYCAAAGLRCVARYGGEPGCMIERENVLDCGTANDHQSDWCVCGR